MLVMGAELALPALMHGGRVGQGVRGCGLEALRKVLPKQGESRRACMVPAQEYAGQRALRGIGRGGPGRTSSLAMASTMTWSGARQGRAWPQEARRRTRAGRCRRCPTRRREDLGKQSNAGKKCRTDAEKKRIPVACGTRPGTFLLQCSSSRSSLALQTLQRCLLCSSMAKGLSRRKGLPQGMQAAEL